MTLSSAEMRRGITAIEMHQEGTNEFFSLPSFEIKRTSYSTPSDYTEFQLLEEFRSVRDMILCRPSHSYTIAYHLSAS
jgi:hypothetical protein